MKRVDLARSTGIGPNTMARLSKDQPVQMNMLGKICEKQIVISEILLTIQDGENRKDRKGSQGKDKINKLLEEAGWRFFEEDGKPANIQVEPNVKITQTSR